LYTCGKERIGMKESRMIKEKKRRERKLQVSKKDEKEINDEEKKIEREERITFSKAVEEERCGTKTQK
jgi:hypothetical protein